MFKISRRFDCILNGSVEIFSSWICYSKATNPDKIPPFSNDEGAEVLLQHYFKTAPEALYEYLGTNEKTFIANHITPRSDRINYHENIELSETVLLTVDEFKSSISQSTFPHISDISFLLFDKYNARMNEEEAI